MIAPYKYTAISSNSYLTINSKYDPTRTITLRNAFVKEMDKRFAGVEVAIYKKVVEDDFFALSPIQVNAYPFSTSAAKVAEFMEWLKDQVNEGILSVQEYEQLGAAVQSAWTNLYITDSYKRGVIRARSELQKAGYTVPTIEATGGIAMSMVIPLHMDRVGLLFTRTYTDLKGITDTMASQISRVLAQGLADGDNPLTIAKKLLATINGNTSGTLAITDTLGRFIPAKRRAEMLARTEIIRAHHQAMIQEYRNWALEGVIVQAEVVTAGDEKVCDKCNAIALASPYTLDQAENMIPVHPNCRCIALPFEVGVDTLIKKNN